MDPMNIPAAGSRPQKQTLDQAPSVRQNQQQRSDIFGVNSGPVVQTPSRQQQRAKTDIFGVEQSATQSLAQSRVETRQTNTYQSNIFQVDPSSNNTHTAKETIKTQNKGKNTQARHQDHGKDFLFGKSDFDEYKSIKRTSTLKEFKPKEEYDPANRRVKELYGNEIGKEHLPTQKVQLEEKKETVKKQQQQDVDPSQRKQLENSSNVFGQNEKKAYQQQGKQEKLTSQNQKWSTTSKAVDNSGKNYDPDTFAKNKKEKELQSSVFGDESKQTQSTAAKQKLIPTNQTWQQTDTVKNMKDFDPSQSQLNEIDPSQKKIDTLKSALDTHDYKAQPVKHNEKLSVKQQKYKKDVFTRGGDKDQAPSQQKQKQPAQQQQQQKEIHEQSDMI
ncbi:unnamed protein product [Paramecium primaurelia]|uniref:Uncharacterized protein n=1 Tax=Paramecium primaurelia TaxID=5886 RepID=A0A8S1K8A1_PARPR|nr:unnamed protein product [Paramecium primaurelia]